MNKLLTLSAIVLGILLVGLALLYWLTPAGALPPFVPGYEAGSGTIHFKHGLGSLIFGLAAFVFAWFQTGPTSETEHTKSE